MFHLPKRFASRTFRSDPSLTVVAHISVVFEVTQHVFENTSVTGSLGFVQ